MEFRDFYPSENLKPYIKRYRVYTTNNENVTESLYPGGCIELAINISTGNLTTIINEQHIKMPKVEVLGQLTSPVTLTMTKDITLLVATFYSHTSSLFFPNEISSFTNNSIDLNDVFNDQASPLYHQMMEQDSLNQKIRVLEEFLIQKLVMNRPWQAKLNLVERICSHAYADGELFNVKNLALRYGYSERYLQKLFLEFVGITPKSFYNIQRFNKSLRLVKLPGSSFTSIAYECNYFDQSHFIKEFKAFSGVTPTKFQQAQNKEITN